MQRLSSTKRPLPILTTGKSFRIKTQKDVDISKLPSSTYELIPELEQVTIGDMHGNALKFLWILLENEVIKMDDEYFKQIAEIYKKDVDSLEQSDLETFNNIIKNKITIHNKSFIRLLGDEFADRGKNDYFTIKLIERLASEVSFEFICSNHGIQFIKVYENNFETFSNDLGYQAKSLIHLGKLVEKKLVSVEEIDNFVKKYYYPNMRMISYSLSDNNATISIYSHAMIGVNTIKSLAELFKVEYKDDTAIALAATIEGINQGFYKLLQDKAVYKTAHSSEGHEERLYSYEDAPLEYPIVRSIWSRGYDQEKDPPLDTINGYHVRYIHGHDGAGEVRSEYKEVETNLDNMLGKGDDGFTGNYTVLLTKHHQLDSPFLSQLTASPADFKEQLNRKSESDLDMEIKSTEIDNPKVEGQLTDINIEVKSSEPEGSLIKSEPVDALNEVKLSEPEGSIVESKSTDTIIEVKPSTPIVEVVPTESKNSLIESAQIKDNKHATLVLLKSEKYIEGNRIIQEMLYPLLSESEERFGQRHLATIRQATESIQSAWIKTLDQYSDQKQFESDRYSGDLSQLKKAIEFTHEILSIRTIYGALKASSTAWFESRTINATKDKKLNEEIESTLLNFLKNPNFIIHNLDLYKLMYTHLEKFSDDFTYCCGKKSKIAQHVDRIIQNHQSTEVAQSKLKM